MYSRGWVSASSLTPTEPNSRAAFVLACALLFAAVSWLAVAIGGATAQATPELRTPAPTTGPATSPSTSSPGTTATTEVPGTTVAETTPETTPETAPESIPVETAPAQWVPATVEQTTPSWDDSNDNSQDLAVQSSTTVEVTMTTTQDLLVGPPPSTVATTTIPAQDLTSKTVERSSGGSDPKLWAIVAALGIAGAALGVTTLLYWRRTNPGAQESQPGGRGRKQSRYSDLVITVPKSH